MKCDFLICSKYIIQNYYNYTILKYFYTDSNEKQCNNKYVKQSSIKQDITHCNTCGGLAFLTLVYML